MRTVFALSITITLWTCLGLAATGARRTDEQAIKQIAMDWHDAWNRHDMKSLTALVAEDVDFVNVGGKWLKGRKEFEEHHAQRHQMQFKESVWTTTDTHIRFLKPDVAVVHVNWSLRGDRDPDGTPRQPRRGVFTWVVEKREGKWLIVAAQNTNVRETKPRTKTSATR
jgi:uncharacterized protein (TIGR02246 family)